MAALNTLAQVVRSALFTIGQPTNGKEYSWLEWQAIKYLSSYAPQEGNISLRVKTYELGTTARIAVLPADCLRVTRVALKSDHRSWTLTLDTNLMIPEELFSCAENQDVTDSNLVYNQYWPAWAYGSPYYSAAGGRNVNYYRIVGQNIIFDHNIPAGQLYLEYLSNGSEINENTMINIAYFAPMESWLMAQWYLHRGSSKEKGLYQEFMARSVATGWNANIIVNAPRLAEMIDAINQSSSPNYA